MEMCGARTKAGGSCRWPRPCTYHPQADTGSPETGTSETATTAPPPEVPAAVDEHDLRELAWWVVRRLITGGLPAARELVAVMRVLASLDEPPPGIEDDRRTDFRARMALGMPLIDDDDWAMAEEMLDPETLMEIRRRQEEADRLWGPPG